MKTSPFTRHLVLCHGDLGSGAVVPGAQVSMTGGNLPDGQTTGQAVGP